MISAARITKGDLSLDQALPESTYGPGRGLIQTPDHIHYQPYSKDLKKNFLL